MTQRRARIESSKPDPVESPLWDIYRCELLIRELVYRADLGDRATVADLFVADGVYSLGPDREELFGREAIRAWFTETATPTRPLARHLCTNTTIRFLGRARVEATTYVTLVRLVHADRIPAPFKGIQSIGVYCDELVKIDDEWFFKSRRYEPTFVGAP